MLMLKCSAEFLEGVGDILFGGRCCTVHGGASIVAFGVGVGTVLEQKSDDFGCAFADEFVDGGAPDVVADVGVCTFFEEEFGHVGGFGDHVEGDAPIAGLLVDIGSVLDEEVGGVGLSFADGGVEWSASDASPVVGVGTMVDEQLDHFNLT